MFADLHIHTNHSDGLLDVQNVIYDAKEKGLKVIAITDHDTIQGNLEIQKGGWEIEVIPGVEVTVSKKLHILGYFVDSTNECLKKNLESMALKKARWLIRLVRKMSKEQGKSFEEFLSRYGEVTTKSVNKWLIEINEGKYTKSEICDKYFWNDDNEYGKYPTFTSKEAIELIEQAGGIAVLSHPALLWENNEQFERLLKRLVKEGLKGLEVYHVLNEKAGLEEYFMKMAKKELLLVSGGSDFHGMKNKYTKIGEYGLSEEEWNKFSQLNEREGSIRK